MEIYFDVPDEREYIVASSIVVPRVGEYVVLRGCDYSVVSVEYEFAKRTLADVVERVIIHLVRL